MKHERPEELPHIQDRTWVPILKEISDHKVPEERRILLAKKVLRSDYVQAWVEVMEEYRRLQPDTRWGRENWMDKISGPIRLKALKVLQGHPGPSNRHWDAAIAALALCCKAKDIPALLRICKLAIVDGKYDLEPMDIGWCFGRIILWKPEQDYPELFDFLEQHLWDVDEHLRQEFFHLLLNSNHPRAESMLLAAIERGADTYWGLLGEWYLFLWDEAKYLERAQAALAHYKGLGEALFTTEYLKYLSENALRNFEYEINDFLEGDDEEDESQEEEKPDFVLELDEDEVERLVARLKAMDAIPEPLQRLLADMVFVEGDTFPLIADDEEFFRPLHLETNPITLTDFAIGKYPVTQSQWEAVMGTRNWKSEDCPDCPMENVTWFDCQLFLAVLSRYTGEDFRLPTDAQWEFAAQGGVFRRNPPHRYPGSNDLNRVGWYEENSGGKLHPVGLKEPNRLGIYDMAGSVREWCYDVENPWYFFKERPLVDPTGARHDGKRIQRGGCYAKSEFWARLSQRHEADPNEASEEVGFRVAKALRLGSS